MKKTDQSERDILDFVILHKLRFEVNRRLGATIAESMRLKEKIVEDMIFSIEGFVLADRLLQQDVQITFPFPKNWWEHLKLNLMPHLSPWISKRISVKKAFYHHTIRLEKYLAYPKAGVELPQDRFGKPMNWEIWRTHEIGVEGASRQQYGVETQVKEVARRHS